MFNVKTVFVVGAGGSKEVGLPIGDGLRDRIGDKLRIGTDRMSNISSGDSDILDALRYLNRESDGRIPKYYFDLANSISRAMPQAISIDNYLHFHSRNPKLVEVGKLGIAASILEAEASSSIATENQRPIDFRTVGDSWHNTFCKMLTEGVTSDDVHSMFDNVSFITFNYDRVIEHFVCQWLCAYLRVDMSAAQILTRRLQVIHPYGTVGALPWQGVEPVIGYGQRVETADLIAASRSIRTFTEGSNEPQIDSQIHDVLSAAERVVFLGFSYLPLNLQLLNVQSMGPTKTVFGTSLGMSRQAKQAATEDIKRSLSVAIGHPGKIEFSDQTCNDFLKDYWRAIL